MFIQNMIHNGIGRCNIIHVDKPYALFSYAEESEIKCLKCINELLDEFIENNCSFIFRKWSGNGAVNVFPSKRSHSPSR